MFYNILADPNALPTVEYEIARFLFLGKSILAS